MTPAALATIADLGTRALAGASNSEIFQEAVDLLLHVLNADACFILQYDPANARLSYLAGRGWRDPDAVQFDMGEDSAGAAFFSPGALVIPDFSADSRFAKHPIFRANNLNSGISAKITSLSAPYGIVGVYHRLAQNYSEQETSLLINIANLLAAAVYRNQGHENLKKLTEQLENEVLARTRLVQLLQDVTTVANQAESIAQAMQTALDMICNYTGWNLGHVFLRGPNDNTRLISSLIWSTKDKARFEAFISKTAEIDVLPGKSLPGKVLESGELVLRRHIAAADQLRSVEAKQCGIVDGLAFPVIAGKEIVAVLEFFTLQPMGINLSLIEALGNIGAQLGHVVERKQTEQALRANEQQLAQAQRIAHMGSYDWDILNNRVAWSDELYRIYGLPTHFFKGTVESFLDLVHPEDRERTQAIITQSVNNCQGFEFTHRIIRPDGEVRIIRARGQPVLNAEGRIVRMIGAGQDITEQVLADEKLRAGEELLRRVVTAAPLIIWSIDRDGKIILAEGRALTDLKVDPAQIIGLNIFDLLKDTPQIANDVRRALAGEEIITEVSGENGIYETRYAPLHNDVGEIIGMVAMALNINERVEMENALRASEARFRTIFESSAVGKAILDLQTKVVVANQSLQNMLGYTNAEISGRSLADLLLPLDYQNNRALYDDFFDNGINIIQSEQRLLHKDNHIVWGNFTFSWMRKSNGEPWFAIMMVEDITARKQAEAELSEVKRQLIMSREAERLRLAQELHDDPLQELYGVMYTLSDFGKYIQQPEGLDELQNTQDQVTHIIDSLRGICRDLRPPALSPFGLEGAIHELAERFQNDHPDIQFNLDLMDDKQMLDEHVRLTLFRIVQQALSNIVRHAQATQVTIRFTFDPSHAELEIKDNGKGFNVPRRWVSLVRQGHLGLAGAAERVETVDGKLNVYSQPGEGTTIHVNVPRQGAAEVI